MPTQRDVAKEAGVSSATVSRFLNNSSLLRPEIAEKVKQAIEKLGYRLDFYAQSLKTGKYFRIGIISASIGAFYMEMLRYIEDYLSRFGYFVNVSFSRFQDTSYRKTVDLIKNKQADGFIIFPRLTSEDDEIIDYLINFNEKFVVIDRYINNDKIYQVRIDNYKAGRLAAEVLLNKGHKDFLFIWGHTDILSSHERYDGFSDRLKEAGIILSSDRQINGEFDADYTYTTVMERFKDLPHFTAVFSSNDLSASGFIKACYINGKKPVDDYSIIGFDDDVHSRYMTPSLSTFCQPLKEMGIMAAEMLVDLIENRQVDKTIVSFDAIFIERESS